MTSPNGQFLDLNAQLVKRHPNIHKLRPGVVRRTHPEPDRSHVEGAPPPKPPSALDQLLDEHAREREPEPVAAKKKRTHLDPETWEVAVARVQSLVGAGNTAKGSIEKVAKEHKVSFSALAKRYNDAPKPNAEKKRASKKAPNGSVAANGQTTPPELSALDLFLDIIELCERAKNGLTKAQRVRLRTALNERLS